VTAAAGDSTDVEQPVLVGRAAEISRFDRVLDTRAPALVLIAGATGMGKSSFLRAVQIRATLRGWRSPPRLIAIDARSDEQQLAATIIAEVGASSDRLENEGDSANATQRRSSGSFVVPGMPRATSQFVARLQRRAPLLVCIEGYRPSPAFNERFLEIAGAHLPRAAAPVVIAIADLPSALAPLRPFAGEQIELGELPLAPVREHLERLGTTLHPPIAPDELLTYVRAVGKNPGFLGALTRVLQVERADRPNGGASS
jgi:hypothetical protein